MMNASAQDVRTNVRTVWIRRLVLTAMILAFVIFSFRTCFKGAPALPTIDGPETSALNTGASGCVTKDHPVGGIVATRLVDLKEFVVRPSRKDELPITSVSGPDAEGWVAFVEDDMEAKSHHLKVIKMDGSDEQWVYSRPGDTIWDNPITPPLCWRRPAVSSPSWCSP
ncbi:MAG TPA: hypothetical protein VMH37_13265 [Candidatus Binataceae bacterium]|nr:hypothetical protein [Candidatus Binataceae bacterium]